VLSFRVDASPEKRPVGRALHFKSFAKLLGQFPENGIIPPLCWHLKLTR
jgi:hypothetical protein